MKKLFWILSLCVCVVLLLAVAILAAPFLIDFNRFKPIIQNIVAEKTNANIDFSSARLFLWPRPGVRLKNVEVVNGSGKFAGTKLFSVNDFDINVEFMPLFEKRIVGDVFIDKPEIVFVSEGLTNNVVDLKKPVLGNSNDGNSDENETQKTDAQNAEKLAEASNTPPATSNPEIEKQIEDLKRNLVIRSFQVKNASVNMRNLQNKDVITRASNIDVLVQNIGFGKEVSVAISTAVKYAENGNEVSGPLKTNLTLKADLKDVTSGPLQTAILKGKVDFDALNINARNAFLKKPSIPLNVQIDALYNAVGDSVKINVLNLNLSNLALGIAGEVSSLASQTLNMNFNLNSPNLDSMVELLPEHKSFLTGARLKLDGAIEGSLKKPEFLKSELNVDSGLNGADFLLKWRSSQTKPLVAQIDLQSKQLNVAKLLAPFSSQAAAGSATSSSNAPSQAKPEVAGDSEKVTGNATSTTNITQPQEFKLSAEQKKLLAGMAVDLNVGIGSLITTQTEVKNLKLVAGLKGFQANVKQLELNAFSGVVQANLMSQLDSSPLPYSGKVVLKNIESAQLLPLFAPPEHKEVLKGKANINLEFSGKGTSKAIWQQNLNGKGDFAFLDGELKTGSITQAAQKEFDGYVAQTNALGFADSAFAAAEKILANPLIAQSGAAKQLNVAALKSEYEKVKSLKIAQSVPPVKSLRDLKGSLEIKQGRIALTSATETKEGKLNFNGSVGLDMSLKGTALYTIGEIVKQKMLTQTRHAALLFDENKNLILPMTLSGTATDPRVTLELGQLGTRLERNAKALAEKEIRARADKILNDLLRGKADAALAELKKQQEVLKQKAAAEQKKLESQAKDELKKLKEKNKDKLKGLFGN